LPQLVRGGRDDGGAIPASVRALLAWAAAGSPFSSHSQCTAGRLTAMGPTCDGRGAVLTSTPTLLGQWTETASRGVLLYKALRDFLIVQRQNETSTEW
jgi:hypothetical protein